MDVFYLEQLWQFLGRHNNPSVALDSGVREIVSGYTELADVSVNPNRLLKAYNLVKNKDALLGKVILADIAQEKGIDIYLQSIITKETFLGEYEKIIGHPVDPKEELGVIARMLMSDI